MWLWGRLRPLPAPVALPERAAVDLTPMRGLRPVGTAVLAATALLLWTWR